MAFGNNPVNFTDPFGLEVDIKEGIFAGVGAAGSDVGGGLNAAGVGVGLAGSGALAVGCPQQKKYDDFGSRMGEWGAGNPHYGKLRYDGKNGLWRKGDKYGPKANDLRTKKEWDRLKKKCEE